MDYVEAFRNLRTNQKYSRKSPHKAVLLLTVISLIEKNMISDNEIKYDDALKEEFLALWNKLLPYEVRFFPDAYLPFWYMENERFWHIVPLRGKEDIVTMMRDDHIKPSCSKLTDCVNYAELDEDLYFLMTMSFGREQLREALLETYFELSDAEIARLKCDTYVKDTSSDIEDIAVQNSTYDESNGRTDDKDYALHHLPIDIQIELNYNYYAFLKKHPFDRDEFLKLFPDVSTLHRRITSDYLASECMTTSFVDLYKDFLQELKIALMSCNTAMDLIDSISYAMSLLEDDLADYVNQVTEESMDNDLESDIDDYSGETYNPISAILDKDNDSEYKDDPVVSSSEYSIVNLDNDFAIYDSYGFELYSSSGNVKMIDGQYFRFNYKGPCFTVKELIPTGDTFRKGPKLLVAYSQSKLYKSLNPSNFITDIEDFKTSYVLENIKIRVRGVWYDYEGSIIDSEDNAYTDTDVLEQNAEERMERYWDEKFLDYKPKGKLSALRNISDIVESSYDFLWLMAIADLMNSYEAPDTITFDEMACMMIANAWELFCLLPEAKEKESQLAECVDFLIEESKEFMDIELTKATPKDIVYEAIKDYPMANVFEDTVEELVKRSPFMVLKAWYPDSDLMERIEKSSNYEDNCLYSITMRKNDPYITVNPKSKRSLMYDHDSLIHYLQIQYKEYYSI